MSEEEKVIYDINAIKEIIPHRYPFLLIDRVIEFVDNERACAIKNVTANEPFFNGHFPNLPIMPGVLILEAIAQTAAILATKSTDGVGKDKTVFLVGADEFRWKRKVVPGDTLRIEVKSVKKRRPMWVMSGEAYVGSKLVACGTLSAAEG